MQDRLPRQAAQDKLRKKKHPGLKSCCSFLSSSISTSFCIPVVGFEMLSFIAKIRDRKEQK